MQKEYSAKRFVKAIREYDMTQLHMCDNFIVKSYQSILRMKDCMRIGREEQYTYFERIPDGEVYVGPYNGFQSQLLIAHNRSVNPRGA